MAVEHRRIKEPERKRNVASGKSLLRVAAILKHGTNEGSFSLISTGRGSEGFCFFGMQCRSQAESLFHSPLHLLTAITKPQPADKLLGCALFLKHPVFLTSETAGLTEMFGLYLRNSCERCWLVIQERQACS